MMKKAVTKIQHPFMINALKKLGKDGALLDIIKAVANQ
jgi:hypothetical protein